VKKKTLLFRSDRERGQTIILVAISLISLLGVAALAIDIVTLYVARSETQRAADAAALAAAKAIADSGFTTLPPSDPNLADAQALAQQMARHAIHAMLNANPAINQVAGIQPALVGTPTLFFPASAIPPNSNPHITVTLQVTGLPTFFARIWGNRTATVTASATAEAYNPANVQLFTPIAPKGVKPWLVANLDPTLTPPTTPFITTATGGIENSVIGKTFNLTADCTLLPANSCNLNHPTPQASYITDQVDYVPATVTTNSSDVCPSPSLCTESATYPDYQHGIQCHDVTPNPYPCGGPNNNFTWDSNVNPGSTGGPSALGAECLIHASTAGQTKGQDVLTDPVGWPDGPRLITAPTGPPNHVTTSSSIVTIPIIDQTSFQATSPFGVTVVGFMQAFVNWVQDGTIVNTTAGDINITVLNIAGCSNTNNGSPPVVGGSGTSPVPVRLITPP
jgi:hypothetical protein